MGNGELEDNMWSVIQGAMVGGGGSWRGRAGGRVESDLL